MGRFFWTCVCVIFMWNNRLKSSGELLCFDLVWYFSDWLMGDTSKSSFLWFREFRTCPRFPKPIIFIFGDTRIPKTNQEKTWNISQKYHVLKLKVLESQHAGLIKFRISSDGINIYRKTWHGNLGCSNSAQGIPPTHASRVGVGWCRRRNRNWLGWLWRDSLNCK